MNGATFDLLCDIDAKLSQIQQLEDDTNTGVCGIRCTIDEIRDEIVHMCRKFDEAIDKLSANLFLSLQNTKEEKGKHPHTPLKEKGEKGARITTRARTCGGIHLPDLETAIAVAATLNIDAETAKDFWYFYDGQGWRAKNGAVLNWQSMLMSFARGRKRLEMKEAERTAHLDEKMDAREAKRERRAGGGRRKADNNVEMSDEVREEVRRDFTF